MTYPPAAPSPAPATLPGADIPEDEAIRFLQTLAPRTDGDRSRAFAALLVALTTGAGQ